MLIPYILESTYRQSIWARQTVDGLMREASRKKYTVVQLDGDHYRDVDPDEVFGNQSRLLLLIGTSFSWMPEVMAHFEKRNVKCIVINFDPAAMAQGVVRMDHLTAMQMLLAYLEQCGKRRVALYGLNPNSSADNTKRDYFESAQTDGKVFLNDSASMENCYRAFSREREQFDAVICANDIVAASLLRRLKADHVRVPEDLFLLSFGNSTLSAMTKPSITTVTLEHEELGRQAVNLYAFLSKQELATTVSVRVRCKIIVRDSTAGIPYNDQARPHPQPVLSSVDFYSDPETEQLMNAENLLTACDDTDRAFLHGLLCGLTNEALEERLFLSASALRYRLKRLMSVGGCPTREAFQQLLALCQELGFFEK